MRKWLATLPLVLALSPSPAVAARDVGAAPATTTTWMTVMLAGQRIGHLRLDRSLGGNVVTTTQDLQIELNRNGSVVPMEVLTRSVETLDGQPLGFYSRSTLSHADSIVDGQRQADGSYAVTATVAGLVTRTSLVWPTGALLSDGQRQAMARAIDRTGPYTLSLFDPSTRAVAAVDVEVLGNEWISLPDGPEWLSHQREVLQTARDVQRMDLWINARGETRKGELQMLGHPLEMLACSQACALAPVQDIDMLRAAMVESPAPVTPSMRRSGLRYLIHTADENTQPVIATDEQHMTPLGHGDWLVEVGDAQPGGQPPPTAEDALPNVWLQSDAPEVRVLAVRAAGRDGSDLQKMARLRDFVSSYISERGKDVGYASAVEVVRTRKGDCKESAVLLAALARAEGIPARVVSGMVYVNRYGGSAQVFVPHAWMQAWVDGRWQSYDAALGHFDSAHIALDSSDGDPWHFTNLANLFGQMHIARISPTPDTAHSMPQGAAVATRDW